MKLKKQFEKLVQKYIDELIEISGKDEDGDYIFYLDFFKVHRILLGRALFEFCWIIWNENNQTKQSNILWEGQLWASFKNIFTWYKFVFVITKI